MRVITRYLKRVEDVLGKGWKEQRGGKELYNDGESFRKKLDTQVRGAASITCPTSARSHTLSGSNRPVAVLATSP